MVDGLSRSLWAGRIMDVCARGILVFELMTILRATHNRQNGFRGYPVTQIYTNPEPSLWYWFSPRREPKLRKNFK